MYDPFNFFQYNTSFPARDIAVGFDQTFIFNNFLYGCGANGNRQIFNSAVNPVTTPLQVDLSSFGGTSLSITKFCVGENFFISQDSSNVVRGEGFNNVYQIGDGLITQRSAPFVTNTAYYVGTANISAIYCGKQSNLLITSAGQLYGWGANSLSQLGNGYTATITSPQLIEMYGAKSSIVAAGDSNSALIANDNLLYVFGQNSNYQLGDGSSFAKPYWVRPISTNNLLTNTTVSRVCIGKNHVVLITANGTLLAYGQGTLGQMGSTVTSSQSSPGPVNTNGVISYANNNITSLVCGADHVLVLINGTVIGWGNNIAVRIFKFILMEKFTMLFCRVNWVTLQQPIDLRLLFSTMVFYLILPLHKLHLVLLTPCY